MDVGLVDVGVFMLIAGLVSGIVQKLKVTGDSGFVAPRYCSAFALGLGLGFGLLCMLPPASLSLLAAVMTGVAGGLSAVGGYELVKTVSTSNAR